MNIKSKIKKSFPLCYKVVTKMVGYVACCKKQISVKRSLKKISHKHANNRRIKVGYIVQMPEIWDKEAPVFETMMEDIRFDPYLLVVPAYDLAHSRIGGYGVELDFFIDKYGKDRIIRLFTGQWADLQFMEFDYVFYQRCWEMYLPRVYQTDQVLKYAKTCYIPYCFHCLIDEEKYYQSSFFQNLYLFFCCSEQQMMQQKPKKYGKNIYNGYPVLGTVLAENKTDHKTILWTPRWTDDKETGGSTFYKYWQLIPEIKKHFETAELILRPHPLLFQNAVKTNQLSREMIDQYNTELNRLGIKYDKNALIENTFSATDILISDFSSVLVPFFTTGKPLIYCSDTNVAYSDIMKEIINCSYIAKDWNDILTYLHSLMNGLDPLKDRRESLAKRLYEENRHSVERILNTIFEDANNLNGGE